MFHPKLIALQERLAASPSPVERDIAALLSHLPVSARDDDAFRLQRYHRKIDVAHKLMAAYDDRIERAMSAATVSSDGYMGLAFLFVGAAHQESGVDDASRANILRWANSAFNCLDHVEARDAGVATQGLDAELRALVRKGSKP